MDCKQSTQGLLSEKFLDLECLAMIRVKFLEIAFFPFHNLTKRIDTVNFCVNTTVGDIHIGIINPCIITRAQYLFSLGENGTMFEIHIAFLHLKLKFVLDKTGNGNGRHVLIFNKEEI